MTYYTVNIIVVSLSLLTEMSRLTARKQKGVRMLLTADLAEPAVVGHRRQAQLYPSVGVI